ncbi:MAG: TIGR01212 family radical SAM protein [Clostridiales bacterium]|nr:TIGR01212 family radical SAM protein [Clostridiales bacterium]
MITASRYFLGKFGHKMYKAAISLDVTCPNRDGRKGTGGCAFCSAGGSGEFASSSRLSVREQIDDAILKLSSKVPSDTGYIAYFQSFTSTYCDAGYLRQALEEAASHPKVEAISIGTRPDCLPKDILSVLSDVNETIPLYVELGLQTSDDAVAASFGRGYETSCYDEAVKALKDCGINVITHIIFGLPGESVDGMIRSVKHAVDAGTDGLKFTCLYILKGTRYEKLYSEGKIEVLECEEYFDSVEKSLDEVPDHVVIHRLTGDGPKSLLMAPGWTANKRQVINYINRRFKDRL